MSYKILALLALCASMTAFADENPNSWSETKWYYGCGSSNMQARAEARSIAESYKEKYAKACAADEGQFTASVTDGSCSRHQGDLSCPYECIARLKASCQVE